MTSSWTFGRTITAGFAAVLALNVLAGGIALVGMRSVVASKDEVIATDAELQAKSNQLLLARSDRSAALRAFLLTGKDSYFSELQRNQALYESLLTEVQLRVHTSAGRVLLQSVIELSPQSTATVDALVALKRSGAKPSEISAAFLAASERASLKKALVDFSNHERQLAIDGARASTAMADRDMQLILATLLGTILATAALAFVITRRLRSRIGSAVGEVQSSSVELQTTANQQAVGAMEQATAMSEISMTITELLASSQQIAESAQRVADSADQTAGAGRSGQHTVTSAQQSMSEIRRQVDAIVDHMVELGDKSRRIGAVLDIVSELAEQTNILAINSTIEAAGAGESGRRFAVVADEIRKLADRVAQSTKEIRNLIDVVRGAVHTTVLATEIGSKAVDAGTAQFGGVAASFEQIMELMETTTQAAREIELSTRQQTTAVEQVNLAVANVTETTRESEAGSSQTLRTASQLADLSTQLRSLVEPATASV